MSLQEKILYRLSHSRVKNQVEKLKSQQTEERGLTYAQSQFEKYLKRGVHFNFQNKTILEIGCGHGGIATFFAINGAKKVYGLDINEYNLEIANKYKEATKKRLSGSDVPLEFINQNVHNLSFDNDHFDIIIADNVFEHFDDNVAVLRECKRVLKTNGIVVVPSFPSIYSKHGAHLKKGVAVPWVYAFFSEKAIVSVLKRNSKEFPILLEVYAGLKNNPETIRDVRAYKDLNYITNKKFKSQVTTVGMNIKMFEIVYAGRIAKLISKFIPNKFSILQDILSLKSIAVLEK